MTVVVRHDANIPIGGRVGSAMRGQHSLIAGWPLWGLKCTGLQVLVHEKRHHALEHGDLDLLPFSSALTVKQGHRDSIEQKQSAGLVRHHRWRVAWLTSGH